MSNASIDDLLNALKNPNKQEDRPHLPNTRETWARIGDKDSFSELGLGTSELAEFLTDWISENPYNNI